MTDSSWHENYGNPYGTSGKNAQQLASYLAKHLKVLKLHYPGLDSHPNHDTHLQQAKNGGAVLPFELASKEELMTFTHRIQLPILAVILGGVESILSHTATISHAGLSSQARLEQGVVDGLLPCLVVSKISKIYWQILSKHLLLSLFVQISSVYRASLAFL